MLAPTLKAPATPVLFQFRIHECALHWHSFRSERNQRWQVHVHQNRKKKAKRKEVEDTYSIRTTFSGHNQGVTGTCKRSTYSIIVNYAHACANVQNYLKYIRSNPVLSWDIRSMTEFALTRKPGRNNDFLFRWGMVPRSGNTLWMKNIRISSLLSLNTRTLLEWVAPLLLRGHSNRMWCAASTEYPHSQTALFSLRIILLEQRHSIPRCFWKSKEKKRQYGFVCVCAVEAKKENPAFHSRLLENT